MPLVDPGRVESFPALAPPHASVPAGGSRQGGYAARRLHVVRARQARSEEYTRVKHVMAYIG